MIPLDDVVHFEVTTSDPTDNGSESDADSTPTFSVFEEANDTPILSAQNFTHRGLTGQYRGTFTASAGNGFEAGKWYSVVASATVSGVTGKCPVMLFRVAPAETAAGVPVVQLTSAGIQAMWDALTSGLSTSGSIGKLIVDLSTAVAALNNVSTADVLTQVQAALTAAVADSVPADGSRPSIAQAAYMQTQFLLERTVAGTTVTVKKPDGSTSLFTLTLDNDETPTGITRAS